MASSIVTLVLISIAYGFGPTTKANYSVVVNFDGYIPILGGQQGKVEVKIPIRVKGLAIEGTNQRAIGEITDLKITFNGAAMPFTLENIKEYFPKNTVSFTPEGRIVKNDAPDIEMPVKLPGLDPKRFPDITYLPVEFPSDGVELGREWTYSKSFGSSEVGYTCKVTALSADKIDVALQIAQQYSTFEDEAKNPLKDEKDAAYRVATSVTGAGVAIFDRKLGLIRSFKASADALSKVTDLATKEQTERKLNTKIDVALQTGASASAATPDRPVKQKGGVVGWAERIYNSAKSKGEGWMETANAWKTLLQVGLQALPSILPLPIDQWIKDFERVIGGSVPLVPFQLVPRHTLHLEPL